MDNSLSESARFAVYREKLKGICEANNLSYVFIKNAYPIKLVIRPLGGVGEQMSMLEEASEDNYISPGASILFTVKDGNLTYRISKTFTISDTLFNKIKNIFKNMQKTPMRAKSLIPILCWKMNLNGSARQVRLWASWLPLI